MTEIELFAKHYYKLGLNVTCISNHLNEYNFYCRSMLKNPNHEWEHLLTKRQTETEASLAKRVGKAADEMRFASKFDYELVNRELHVAFEEAESVVNNFLP